MSDLNFIKAAMFTPTRKGWGLPLLLWGDPGAGKSDMIEAWAASWRLPCMVLSPGETGEGGFGVTPIPVKIGGVTRMTYPSPDWVDMFEDSDGRGVVFCDELTTADDHIQAAELGLINNRRIGGAQLPHGVRVIGAANPPEKAANGRPLAPPLANRLGHKRWDNPNEDEWGGHMLGDNGVDNDPTTKNDPALEEARVLKLWPSAWAQAAGLTTAYHNRNRGQLHKMPALGDAQAHHAWASHRSWRMATAALASSQVHKLSEADSIEFMSCYVGEGAMKGLLAFKMAMDLPDPAAVLAGSVNWQHDDDRIDRSMAVLNSLASYAISLRLEPSALLKDARIDRLWKIIDATPADDVIAMAIKPLTKARISSHPGSLNVMARLRPMLVAAGLTL